MAKSKKTPKKAETKAETKKVKTGPKPNQIKILQALDKKNGLSRAEIAKVTKIDNASLTGYIGPVDDEKRRYNDETYFTTLVTMGYVKHKVEEDGVVHILTPAGLKFLRTLDK